MSKRIVVHTFGGPEVLTVEHVTRDLVPRSDQILVRVEAFGINPVETYTRSGHYDPLPSLPYTPGSDAAGLVLSVGADVENPKVKEGDRVWITGSVSGTYAQMCVCNSSDVHPLPDYITFAQGAGIGVPYRTAVRALVLIAKATSRNSVLIHGATGGVGLASLQIARMLGLAPIVATASSDSDSIKQLLIENGATKVFHHGDPAIPNVDIIIEMLANVNLGKDLKHLNKQGRIVAVGNRGEVTIDPRDLMKCQGSVHGMVGPGSAEEKAEIDIIIQKALEGGALRPVVGGIYGIDQIKEAHSEVMTHSKGTRGKIVVNPFN